MDEFVARINWEGLEVATGRLEGGELLCGLDEIVIARREITMRDRMLQERMLALGPKLIRDQEEFGRIVKEIEADPKAKEVVAEWFQKSIQLSPNYNFGYSEHPENIPTVGFGLSGDLGPVTTEPTCSRTFSWDWFNVTVPGKASKIQESGEISFQQSATSCGQEIVRMIFETDVSIRIMRQETAMTRQPDWRIRLLAGSEIWWPSLVDGQNVANGFMT
jgi:hypothetical protein